MEWLFAVYTSLCGVVIIHVMWTISGRIRSAADKMIRPGQALFQTAQGLDKDGSRVEALVKGEMNLIEENRRLHRDVFWLTMLGSLCCVVMVAAANMVSFVEVGTKETKAPILKAPEYTPFEPVGTEG